MVFTSIPAAYLEAANWQQQQQPNHQHGNINSTSQQLLQPPLPPPLPPPVQPHGAGGSAGSIRPGSMADRARMANLPMPETSLRCPRCESTNTKFCYFNNYSLSQPRHFCKTCRRYWTRGGALRNVPVGGGCRRNKRSKGTGTSSKSPAASSDRPTGSASSTNSASSGSVSDIVGLAPNMPPLRFMAPLLHHHQLSDFASGGDMSLNYGLNNNYGTISGPMGGGGIGDMSFQIGNSLNSSLLLSSASSLDQWRIPQQTQQFPFLAGLEGSSSSQANNSGGLYPFEGSAEISGYVRPKVSTSGVLTQFASVKMEDSNRELNLSAQFLGSNNNNVNVSANEHNQYWNVAGGGGSGGGSSASAWNDLSGFSSSSTTSNQL